MKWYQSVSNDIFNMKPYILVPSLRSISIQYVFEILIIQRDKD